MVMPLSGGLPRAPFEAGIPPTNVTVTDTGGVTIAMDNVTVTSATAFSHTEDFESYADNDAYRADPPGYFFQEQNPGNVISLNTDTDFVFEGTQSSKHVGINTAEPKADKCGLVRIGTDVTPPFGGVFGEGVIGRTLVYYYMVDPGTGIWKQNRHFAWEDRASGNGVQIKVTGSSGKWRIERQSWDNEHSNITPPGQSTIPVDQWIKMEIRIKFGFHSTEDFDTFNSADDAWIQIYMDDVAIAEYSCTTMDLVGETMNPTVGFDSVSNTATMYVDKWTWEVVNGPIT